MRKLLIVILLHLSVFILAFNHRLPQIDDGFKLQQTNFKSNKFFVLKYEELLKQKSKYLLSNLVTNIEYVALETNDNCLIQSTASYIFCDSLIFVNNRDHILKFSSDGKFLKRIGNPGRGPGEIFSIWTMSIIPKIRNIVIYDAVGTKLAYYSFDGKLLKTIKAPAAQYIKVMNNNRFIVYESAAAKSENFYFYITDESKDTQFLLLKIIING